MKKIKGKSLSTIDEGIDVTDKFHIHMSAHYKDPKFYYMWQGKPAGLTLNGIPSFAVTWLCDAVVCDDGSFFEYSGVINELENLYTDYVNKNPDSNNMILIMNIYKLFIYEDKYYIRLYPRFIEKIKEEM